MTKTKQMIINQLSIIFDQLEKQYDDKVTFHDVISYVYNKAPKGITIEDNDSIEMLLIYIFANENTD